MSFRIRFLPPPTVLAPLLLSLPTVVASHAVLAGPYDDPGHLPSRMIAWASQVEAFVAGPLDVAEPGLGTASNGTPEAVLGPAWEVDPYDVVSLGDGGSITLSFPNGIGEAPGDDFAVFENGFFSPSGFFGELAFVEVSSNGVDFVRFPSASLQATPVSGDGTVDPTDYHNLGGDQPLGVGTGFDLAALWNDPLVRDGTVALSDVRFVRLVDVIGDGSTLDGDGLPLYDPYPTPFPSGGFDAEAVGVIHDVPEPAATAGIFAGLGGLVALFRRRERASTCRADS